MVRGEIFKLNQMNCQYRFEIKLFLLLCVSLMRKTAFDVLMDKVTIYVIISFKLYILQIKYCTNLKSL